MEFNQMKQKANLLFIVACSALLALVRGQDEYQVVLSQPDSRVDFFDPNVRSTWLENEDDPSATTFTNIGNLDPADYIDGEGYYTFKMVYINLDESIVTLEWKQTSWLTASGITGFVPINVPPQDIPSSDHHYFEGLGMSGDILGGLMDGNGGGDSWWNNAGTISQQDGGTPGFNQQHAYSTTLYAARTSEYDEELVLTVNADGSVPFDTGDTGFNNRFWSSGAHILKRVCASCASSHQLIYYKRLTMLTSFDMYYNTKTAWTDTNNIRASDFNLYSSLEDLENNVNAWTTCNYNDVANLVGFPRDCGPTGGVGCQFVSTGEVWSGSGCPKTASFYILSDYRTASPTAAPSTAPTTAPTAAPTSAPTHCDGSSIATFDWDELMTAGAGKPEVVAFNMSVDATELALEIDISLTYVGRSSADIDAAVYGTTYVLDFDDFDAHKDSIASPGTCQNRNANDFTGAFHSWWEYPQDQALVGTSSSYLAYPPANPASGQWSISADEGCGVVTYSGAFTWNDLTACQDFGQQTDYVTRSEDEARGKLSLTGTFYVNLVSPVAANVDLGYYRVYQLLSQPFVISVNKNIQVLRAAGINLFQVSVIAVYKEESASLFKLVVLTESAEYLKLSRSGVAAGLAAFESGSAENAVPQLNQFTVADSVDSDACLNKKDYICSQLWQIESPGDCSSDRSQSIDFSGEYTLQFTPVCRTAEDLGDAVLATYCATWLAAHDDIATDGVGLTATLEWRDEECDPLLFEVQFQADMLFYADAAHLELVTAESQTLYRVGEDRVYVEVETGFPGDYDVFDTQLLNVWICTMDPLTPPVMPIEPSELSGGCFSDAIDDNAYAYHIYDSQSTVSAPELIAFASEGHPSDAVGAVLNDKVRFSFVVPEQVARDKLYIHAQIEVSLAGSESQRRRQLLRKKANRRAMSNQMSHFLGTIGVSSQPQRDRPVQLPAPGSDNGMYRLPVRSSPWLTAIVGLMAVILTSFVAFWCFTQCCARGRGVRVLFSDYEKVKIIDSEFDDSEANAMNVVSE